MSNKALLDLRSPLLLLVLACLVSWPTRAAQDVDTTPKDGLEVKVELRHQVIIPQIIYFRVGSATFNDVDKVTFDVSPGATPPGNNQTYGSNTVPIGDGTVVNATSNGTLEVYIMANVGTLNISYAVANTLGLENGLGQYIAYREIDVQSSDPGLPTPTLDNSAGPVGSPNSVDVFGNLYGGLVTQRSARWTYRYLNNTTPAAGTYKGSVRYTVSAP